MSIPEFESTRLVIGVTGASGSLYANGLLELALRAGVAAHLVATETAVQVVQTEIPGSLLGQILTSSLFKGFENDSQIVELARQRGLDEESLRLCRKFSVDDLYSPIASGSLGATHMCVVPCSMGTLARIAHGISQNLLERCADVMLKEKRKLVIVPRETPINLIHLNNMKTLLEAGADMLPAMPGFYHRPKKIEDISQFMVERMAQMLEIDALSRQNRLLWNPRQMLNPTSAAKSQDPKLDRPPG